MRVCVSLDDRQCLLPVQPPPRPEIPSVDGEDLAAKLHKVTLSAISLALL